MRFKTYRAPLMVLIAFVLSAPCVGEAVLEEVTVTAQKREESIQDVPISITAFSGEQIDALNISDFTQITQQIPSLQLNTWSPKLTIFNLRGVSQNTFNDNNEGPIAVYIDDAYVGSLNGISGQLFDMERVEVLRGPQGTLFGRNATGGLIQYLSRGADDEEFNGYAEVTVARFADRAFEFGAGGSFHDKVRVRVAGRYQEADGYVKSVDTIRPGASTVLFPGSGQDIGGVDGYAGRANVQIDFNEKLRGSFWLKYSEDNEVATGGFVFEQCNLDVNSLCPTDEFGRTVSGDGVIDLFGQPADVHEHYGDFPGFMNREQLSTSGRFDYDFDNGMQLVSVTNYMTNDYSYAEDGDALAVPVLTFGTFVDYTQWSQELRFSGETDRFRWQTGFYYLNMEWDGGASATGAPAFGNVIANGRILAFGGNQTALATANPFNGFEGAVASQNYVLDSRNWSIFGQAEYDLTEDLTVVAGLRWSQDNKDIDWTLTFADNFNPLTVIQTDDALAAINPGVNEIDYGDWAARVVLNWQPMDSTLLFASWNRGIKGGNWSIGVTSNIDATTFQHNEEVLNSLEAGFKSDIDAGLGKMRINGTFFYYGYKDYQAFSLAGGGPFIANSDANAYGGEIEFFWTPTENFDFSVGGAFLDSEVDEVLGVISPIGGGGRGTIRDAKFPNAPSVSVNYLARYNVNIGNGNFAAQIDGAYYGDQFFEVTNGSGSFQESFNVSNASISYTYNERVTGTFFVKNFTDAEYLQYSLDLGDLGTTSFYAPPLTWGVLVRVSW